MNYELRIIGLRLFLLVVFQLSIFNFSIYSQDTPYARKVVQTLTSKTFSGRGYVSKGDSLAADFIKNEFIKVGVKPVSASFYQYFPIQVNTFPSSMLVRFDNCIPAEPGKDFLIDPSSKSVDTTVKVVILTSEILLDNKELEKFFKKDLRKMAVITDFRNLADKKSIVEIIDMIKFNTRPVALIEVTEEKLTWHISRSNQNTPHIRMSGKALPEKPKTITLKIESQLQDEYATQNVIGYVKGIQQPDSFIVFSAHYDHLGKMGEDTYFPGANDNASGIAMLLNLADHYAKNPSKYSVVFIAFGAEEVGLEGSKFFTENPSVPLEKIKFLINMDILGTGDEGIMVVNGKVFDREYNFLTALNHHGNYLKEVKSRGKAQNSDHYYFTEKGVPSFFIYTMGGISAYHDIYDRPETLPLTEFRDIFKLLTEFVNLF